jgi:hypothetical protein
LRNAFFSMPTRDEAEEIAQRHHDRHGVPGHLLSIDCSHLRWKNCPKQWAGQYKGAKLGGPTIVLEAAVDYDTYFWHAVFGFPGTQNDLIVWDQSPLLKAMENGHFSMFVDPTEEFIIGGQSFDKFWFLVDGIYPEISRFVKTISAPNSKEEEHFIKWQEGVRKDIERAFGIIQSKFRWLVRPIELWDQEGIERVVIGCIMLHNMMVRYRQSQGVREDYINYAIDEATRHQLDVEINHSKVNDSVLIELGLLTAEDGLIASPGGSAGRRIDDDFHFHTISALYNEQTAQLHNTEAHFKLKEAIVRELSSPTAI